MRPQKAWIFDRNSRTPEMTDNRCIDIDNAAVQYAMPGTWAWCRTAKLTILTHPWQDEFAQPLMVVGRTFAQ